MKQSLRSKTTRKRNIETLPNIGKKPHEAGQNSFFAVELGAVCDEEFVHFLLSLQMTSTEFLERNILFAAMTSSDHHVMETTLHRAIFWVVVLEVDSGVQVETMETSTIHQKGEINRAIL